jgi:hypothetical protein
MSAQQPRPLTIEELSRAWAIDLANLYYNSTNEFPIYMRSRFDVLFDAILREANATLSGQVGDIDIGLNINESDTGYYVMILEINNGDLTISAAEPEYDSD